MIEIPFELFRNKINASVFDGLLYGYGEENDLVAVGEDSTPEIDDAIEVAEFLNEPFVLGYLLQIKENS